MSDARMSVRARTPWTEGLEVQTWIDDTGDVPAYYSVSVRPDESLAPSDFPRPFGARRDDEPVRVARHSLDEHTLPGPWRIRAPSNLSVRIFGEVNAAYRHRITFGRGDRSFEWSGRQRGAGWRAIGSWGGLWTDHTVEVRFDFQTSDAAPWQETRTAMTRVRRPGDLNRGRWYRIVGHDTGGNGGDGFRADVQLWVEPHPAVRVWRERGDSELVSST